MCEGAKGHCNLPRWTRCSWSICDLLSSMHCFIFLRAFQAKVWKHHSRSQRRGLFQYPQSGGSHPLNCSPHNHIKRFRKSWFLFFFYCCCVFPSPEQCPSATGSHNSLAVCARRTSTPRYLIFLIWPRPTSTSTSHCPSEGSTRRSGASPNILISFSGQLPVFFSPV